MNSINFTTPNLAEWAKRKLREQEAMEYMKEREKSDITSHKHIDIPSNTHKSLTRL